MPESGKLVLLCRSYTWTAAVFLLLIMCSVSVAQPFHAYLTWQGNTSTTMTVNYHTTTNPGVSRVYYDTVSRGGVVNNYAFQAAGSSHKVPGLDSYSVRWIHVVELTGLSPAQTYYFIAGDLTTGFTGEMKFATVPDGSEPLRFVTGGDMGTSSYVADLFSEAAQLDPMFVLLGGDIAYADGSLNNWQLWETWLGDWEDNMITPDGFLIPMIMAIGNHEVDGGFGQGPSDAPFYFGYFAQEPGSSYFSRQFGANTILYVLDSGHVTSHGGAQATWLSNEMSQTASFLYKMALYHVPLYPSNRSFDDTYSTAGRTNWLPIFDANHLTVAFENHDHLMKRTHLLKNNQVDPDGTLYLGDGCMGQSPRTATNAGAFYMAKAESKRHFWLVEIPDPTATPNEGITFTAIDDNGAVFDVYELTGPGTEVTTDFQDGVAPSAGYSGTRDTHLSENDPDVNAGTLNELIVDGDHPSGSGKDKYALLSWDISTISQSCAVSAVSITLNVTDNTTNSYGLFEIKKNWPEDEVTWNDYDALNPWQVAGAKGAIDRGTTLLGSLASTSLGAFSIPLNAAGVAVVQSWIDNPVSNNGIIIADQSSANGVFLNSREIGTAGNRPELSITYENPTTALATTIQPQNQQVDEGERATFYVAAEGTAPISYQWQKNTVNIPGVATAIYTTPPVTPADNGAAYRCVISNATENTTSQSAVLTVNVFQTAAVFRVERTTGDVFTDGAFIGGGADLAERIRVSEPVEPGDIVEFDPDNPQYYRKARGNSKLIAGVITTAPGFTLGNHLNKADAVVNDRPMLALMGRVPVKATTENGAIRPGDRLTLSSNPGYSMRADGRDPEKAIIGKALEGLESRAGKIMVLVTTN